MPKIERISKTFSARAYMPKVQAWIRKLNPKWNLNQNEKSALQSARDF